MTGLDKMKTRLNTKAYDYKDNFNNQGKYRSFLSALESSYQAEWITLDKGKPAERRYRCLINPSRLTEQFDKKIISIDFDSKVTEGTAFYWDRTKSWWLVNSRQFTEEAYFRGSICKANYEFEINGEIYRAVLKSPDTRDESWYKGMGNLLNKLNYSLVLQVAKDKNTVDYFTRERITKIKLSYPSPGDTEEMNEEFHNWKVVATDKYTSDFLIDVYLDEWYDNDMEDVREEVEPTEPDIMQPHIQGPLIVHGYDTDLSYSIVGTSAGKWLVSSKAVKITNSTESSCVLEILTGKAGKFILKYVDGNDVTIEQEIIVKSV